METETKIKRLLTSSLASPLKWKAGLLQIQNKTFLQKLYKNIEYYYPLSFLGSIGFFASVYLAGYAYSFSNFYALLIAVPILFFLMVQVTFIRFWALGRGEIEVIWDSNHNLSARAKESEIILKLGAPSIPYFFRYHILVRAVLKAGKEANFYYLQEAASSSSGEVRVGFYFPLCGSLSIKARLLVRDILGLSRTRLGPVQHRNFKVRPPKLRDHSSIPRHAASSLESRQHQRQAEEDKYYMREYIPGDRIKDINWKASLKVGELITRISPQSPEKSPLLYLELRNLSYTSRESPLSLIHLNLLKSWLLAFIIQMRQENPKYRFFLASAEREDMLSTDSDIEELSHLLADLTFVQKNHWTAKGPAVLEKFVFTSGFDPSLKMISQEQATCHIFQLLPGESKKPPQASHRGKTRKTKAPLLRLLPLEQPVPWPGFWILRRGPKALSQKSLKKTGGMQQEMQVRTRIL